ncbi:MAG: hypothetical protein LC687_06080 [Actinobacteria bacterium]|nr:hypothetical protein [Actinomycetota bacterium]
MRLSEHRLLLASLLIATAVTHADADKKELLNLAAIPTAQQIKHDGLCDRVLGIPAKDMVAELRGLLTPAQQTLSISDDMLVLEGEGIKAGCGLLTAEQVSQCESIAACKDNLDFAAIVKAEAPKWPGADSTKALFYLTGFRLACQYGIEYTRNPKPWSAPPAPVERNSTAWRERCLRPQSTNGTERDCDGEIVGFVAAVLAMQPAKISDKWICPPENLANRDAVSAVKLAMSRTPADPADPWEIYLREVVLSIYSCPKP